MKNNKDNYDEDVDESSPRLHTIFPLGSILISFHLCLDLQNGSIILEFSD
jgi:hypothetical protein